MDFADEAKRDNKKQHTGYVSVCFTYFLIKNIDKAIEIRIYQLAASNEREVASSSRSLYKQTTGSPGFCRR